MTTLQQVIHEKIEQLHDVDDASVNAGCIAYHIEGLVALLDKTMGSTDAHSNAMRHIKLILDDLVEGHG